MNQFCSCLTVTIRSIGNVQPTFSYIWLDVVPLVTKENNTVQRVFASIDKNSPEAVDDDIEFQCEASIRSVALGEKLILIVSERMATYIIGRVHDLPQIKVIFIVCDKESQNTLLTDCLSFVKVGYESFSFELLYRLSGKRSE
jgi:hypothetical protein